MHTIAASSDGATVVLEGQAISHGNVALQGWSLSLDSFWTIDAAFYAAAFPLSGLSPALLHTVPALLAALVVATGVWIAVDGRRTRGAVAGTLLVLCLLVLPNPDLTYYLLQGPWHIGTTLWCLLAFLAVARGRFGLPFVAAVALLAAGMLGDLMMLALGVVPCLGAGLLAMARRRSWRGGLPLVAAAVGSIALALVVRLVTEAAGTFTLVNRNLPLKLPRVLANFGRLGHRLPALFGVGNVPIKGLTNDGGIFSALRLLLLVLVVVAVVLGAAALLRGLWRGRPLGEAAGDPRLLDDLLVLAVVVDIVVFVWAAPSGSPAYTKYLTPGVIFGVVLAGRFLARLVDRLDSRALLGGLLAAGLLIGGTFALQLSRTVSRPVPFQPAQPLGTFLLAHGLRSGIADYPDSSIVTVETRGLVVLRPVTTSPQQLLRRFDRQSSASWYSGRRFNFLVYDTGRPWHDVDESTARGDLRGAGPQLPPRALPRPCLEPRLRGLDRGAPLRQPTAALRLEQGARRATRGARPPLRRRARFGGALPQQCSPEESQMSSLPTCPRQSA